MILFVYGSLKRGFSNHAYLDGQQFLGEGTTPPNYRVFDCGGYPGAIEAVGSGPGGYIIRGELWDIGQACLERIDWLEGIDSGLYVRGSCWVWTEDGANREAIIYLYAGLVDDLEETGPDWPRTLDW